MTRLIARHGTAVFLVLTSALSWPLWLVAQVGVFAPAFAGVIVAAWSEAGAAGRAWRTLALVYLPAVALGAPIATRGFTSLAEIGPRWSAALVVFGAWVLCYFARGGNRLVPWPEAPARARTVAAWTAGSALAFAGCAWLPRLLRTRSPFKASLIISFWWALWHAPIDLTADPRWGGIGAVLLRQVRTLPVTVLFTWITIRGGGSLLVPIAVHTTLNARPDFAMSDPARYQRAIGILIVLLALVAVVVMFRDRRLRPD